MPTVTIQPSTADAYFSDHSPTQNQGSSTDIQSGRWQNSGNDRISRSTIKFDVSSIPSSAIVSSAVVGLYINFVSANTDSHLLQRVTADWVESTVTWNNQPGSTSSEQGTAAHVPISTWWNCTITTIVQKWINGTYTNYGVLWRGSNEALANTRVAANSRENAATTERPKLTVTYSSPPTAPTSLAPAGTSYTLSQTVAFTWTHNDPDADAQSAYEIRWRRSGSADAYSTLTANTSTQSRNEPASTFNVGTWEYNVRTKDTGTSTFGAWSTTQTFTVTGIERWGVVHI